MLNLSIDFASSHMIRAPESDENNDPNKSSKGPLLHNLRYSTMYKQMAIPEISVISESNFSGIAKQDISKFQSASLLKSYNNNESE